MHAYTGENGVPLIIINLLNITYYIYSESKSLIPGASL